MYHSVNGFAHDLIYMEWIVIASSLRAHREIHHHCRWSYFHPGQCGLRLCHARRQRRDVGGQHGNRLVIAKSSNLASCCCCCLCVGDQSLGGALAVQTAARISPANDMEEPARAWALAGQYGQVALFGMGWVRSRESLALWFKKKIEKPL